MGQIYLPIQSILNRLTTLYKREVKLGTFVSDLKAANAVEKPSLCLGVTAEVTDP